MQMQLQLSGTGNNYQELAITIMQHLNKGRTRKLIQRSGQSLPLPSKTGQKHPTPYRTIKSHINPPIPIQHLTQLSWLGQDHKELATTMEQQVKKART